MPELPELGAEAERLNERFSGAVLEEFTPLSITALKTASPDPGSAAGEKLTAVTRRGKYLLLVMPSLSFIVHLMQGGRLKIEEPTDKPPPKRPRNGLARWRFESGSLLLTEAGTQKRAGVWTVAGELETQAPLQRLGPDADAITTDDLSQGLVSGRARVHTWLRDQSKVAGIGRRLANEICHRARISPFAQTNRLDPGQVAALHGAISTCISESLVEERARSDMSRAAQRPGSVHNRVGEACPVCGEEVRSVSYSSYTVAYCPNCQTGGRVLADNTTSRFLK